MLQKMPGVFLAGEMIDWEAPTGGYLLQGCFSTGTRAGRPRRVISCRRFPMGSAGSVRRQHDSRRQQGDVTSSADSSP